MRARLFSRVGETRGNEIEFSDEVTLGRNPESSLVLEPSLISSRHARIHYDGDSDCWVLEDLGSLNGTSLDGHRVRGSERLGHLHVITLAGQHDFIFQDLERCAARHGAAVAEPAAPSAEPRLEAGAPEGTLAEKLPVAMPSFLAERSDDDETPPVDRTTIEKAPIAMPSFLADAGSGDDVLDDKTRAEELPISIPEKLSGQAEDLAAPEPAQAPPSGKAPGPLPTHELDPDADLPSPPGDVALSDDLPPPSPPWAPQYLLEFVAAGGSTGQRVLLVEGENVLGRGLDARIRPDSLDISRRHAVLTVVGGSVTVRDLGSRNRTFLEDEEIRDEMLIRPGARLRFGGVEARLILLKGDEG